MKTTPKFKEIEDFIKTEIRNNNLRIGDQIMTEDALCKLFNVSRMTVNKALSNLSNLGYIDRIPGKGSFVALPSKLKEKNAKTSFSEDMINVGLNPGSELISYKLIKANEKPNIAKKLFLNDDDYMHYFVRLRKGNDKPIAISHTYVASTIIPAIDINYLNDGSFYKYLDSIGITERITKDHIISAKIPTSEQKKLLNLDDSMAILKVKHLTLCNINNNLKPFEYVETLYNSDLYAYEI